MPEVYFMVRLPGGGVRECYSPSTIVRQFFARDEEMPIAEFVNRARTAYGEASDRVRAKYGFACGSAAAQFADIENWARSYPADANVRILDI